MNGGSLMSNKLKFIQFFCVTIILFLNSKSLYASDDIQAEEFKQHHLQIQILPDELLVACFSYLDVKSLMGSANVCKKWFNISQDHQLWIPYVQKYPYDSDQLKSTPGRIKEKVFQHQNCLNILSAKKNHDLKRVSDDGILPYFVKFKFITPIERFFEVAYGETFSKPHFSYAHRSSAFMNVDFLSSRSLEDNDNASLWAMLLDAKVPKEKKQIICCANGWMGLRQNPEKAVALNEQLIANKNIEAHHTKINGLAQARYGYKLDQTLAREMNEALITGGDTKALYRKMLDLVNPLCSAGYQCDRQEGLKLINNQIKLGNADAALVRCIFNRSILPTCRDPYALDIMDGYKEMAEKSIHYNSPRSNSSDATVEQDITSLNNAITQGSHQALDLRLYQLKEEERFAFIESELPVLNEKLSIQLQIGIKLFAMYNQPQDIDGALSLIDKHKVHIFDFSILD